MEHKKEVYSTFPYPNLGRITEGVLYELDYIERILGRRVKKIADIGCGTGEYLVAAAKKHPDKEFVGFDLSQSAIDIAGKLISKEKVKNVELQCLDVFSMLYKDEGFDYVVLAGVIEDKQDVKILGVAKDILKEDGMMGINVRAKYAIGDDILSLKQVLRRLTNGNSNTTLHEQSELLKKLWLSVHERHWIRQLLPESIIKSEAHLMNLLVSDSFRVEDMYGWMEEFDLNFVRFVDEHVWTPEFYNLQECLGGVNKLEMYELLAMLRRDVISLEFFCSNKKVKEKDWRTDVLMSSPFGTIVVEQGFVFFDRATLKLDSKREMVLRFFKEDHTLEEALVEIREMSPSVLEKFIELMFKYKVLV